MVIPRLVVAAGGSNDGKTTVATGLTAALTARGLRVAPAKVGPDYIDPGYHAVAAGRPSRTLDPVLYGESLVAPLFAHGARGADVSIVEGVMGLHDGRTGTAGHRGTGHVARLLGAPVLLVLSAAGHGRSLAAIARGLADFDPAVRVGGVLLDRVATDRHAAILRDALAEVGLPVLGALPRDDRLAVPSRHLGLVPAAERDTAVRDWLRALTAAVLSTVDLDAVLAIARTAPALAATPWDPAAALAATAPSRAHRRPGADVPEPPRAPRDPVTEPPGASRDPVVRRRRVARRPGAAGPVVAGPGAAGPSAAGTGIAGPGIAGTGAAGPSAAGTGIAGTGTSGPGIAGTGVAGRRPVVAVAAGPAFTFGYPEHAELLTAAGATVVPLDPLRDSALPAGTGALVAGGGFPECHAAALAANEPLRAAVRRFRGPIVAECGGLLWLADTLDGHPMCGVLAGTAAMTDRLRLGYRDAVAAHDNLLFAAGETITGHEFHRTVLRPGAGARAAWRWPRPYPTGPATPDGVGTGRIHASYLHLHWAARPGIARRLVERAGAGIEEVAR